MNFPALTFPIIGDRLLIAVIGIIHVLVSHGLAIGGSFFIVLLEHKSIRDGNERLNELAYRMAFWFFVLTTSVGALTGVGIWFSTNIFSPIGIGSLLRLFFWVWFIEWFIFIAELALVAVYYLTWHRMSPQKHLRVGVLYAVFSFMTLLMIVGILGFMLTPGKWISSRSFWPAFFNPTFIPQLISRSALSGLLACGFILFVFAFMRSMRDVREEFLRFCGAYFLMFSPVYLVATFAYYELIPARAAEFMPVALATLEFSQYVVWSKVFFFSVTGITMVTGFILYFTRKTYGILSIVPILFLTLGVAQFERVREFTRKPYVIDEYLYSNGIRKQEAPFLSSVGITKYYTWPWRGLDRSKGDIALGNMVYLVECSVCHTYDGVNGIFNKGAIFSSEKSTMQFLNTYQYAYPYMPPFVGTEEEKKALAKFLTEGTNNR